MFNNLPTWAKWTGGLLGSIVVGAIGSGVWARVGDPLYVHTRDGLLNLATLGLVTLKDALYTDVARGLHERASVRMFATFMFFVIYFFFGITLASTMLIRRFAGERPSNTDISPEQRAIRIASLEKQVKWSTYVMWPLLLVATIVQGFDIVKLTYTSRAIANYEQLVNLVGPFVSDADIKGFNSQFAQIRSSRDYIVLNDKLTSIANDHSLVLPDFTPW